MPGGPRAGDTGEARAALPTDLDGMRRGHAGMIVIAAADLQAALQDNSPPGVTRSVTEEGGIGKMKVHFPPGTEVPPLSSDARLAQSSRLTRPSLLAQLPHALNALNELGLPAKVGSLDDVRNQAQLAWGAFVGPLDVTVEIIRPSGGDTALTTWQGVYPHAPGPYVTGQIVYDYSKAGQPPQPTCVIMTESTSLDLDSPSTTSIRTIKDSRGRDSTAVLLPEAGTVILHTTDANRGREVIIMERLPSEEGKTS